MALITALMLLAFLTIVGGAFLSSTTVDMRIGMNYRTNAQLLFVAEAGIEAARESLRSAVEAKINANSADAINTLPEGITGVLKNFDGSDTAFSSSVDVDTLLALTAAVEPLYADAVAVTSDGATIGTYTVFLRNDAADGATSNTDANEAVTLVSIGVVDNSEMLIEVDVRMRRFPDVPSALTLDGAVPNNAFGPGNSNGFAVAGNDAAVPTEASVNGIGVIDRGSDMNLTSEIPSGGGNPRTPHYCGGGTTFTDPCDTGANQAPDVEDISSLLDPTMSTVSGLDAVVAGIESNAMTTCPGNNSPGSSAALVVMVISGDCSMGGGATGWGLLVVKGSLSIGGGSERNGLVIVVGPTACDTIPADGTHYAVVIGGGSKVNGGLLVASTAGGVLADVCLNDQGGGGSGGVYFDSEKTRNAPQGMLFMPIAIRNH
jgi:hypothetical protein